MKVVRHSKIKNPAILFEILTRRIVADACENKTSSNAKRILEKYFNSKSELTKEFLLYQSIIGSANSGISNRDIASDFLNEVISEHKKLNIAKIEKSKYNLIKEITNTYDLNEFMSTPLTNYKLLASIYKIFNAKSLNESVNPVDIINAKYTILNHICGESKEYSEVDTIMHTLAEQDKEIRELALNLIVEKFNNKYSDLLTSRQKNLLKEFIYDVGGTKISSYINTEISSIKSEISEMINKVPDIVIRIKINEAVSQLDNMVGLKKYSDSHVVAIMNYYRLVDELKEIVK